MITKLKERINILKESTTNQEIIILADAAINSCKQAPEYLQSMVAESLINDLKEYDDPATKKFIAREQRILAIDNLGLKDLLTKISESELMYNQQTKYAITSYAEALKYQPEYSLVEGMVVELNCLGWHKLVAEGIATIQENCEKYKEEIFLCNFINEIKNSAGDYLTKFFITEFDNYFVNRDEYSKQALMEKIEPYLYDGRMQKLSNFLKETSAGLQAFSDNIAEVSTIYSPVIIKENSEIFYSSGQMLKRNNGSLVQLSEAELREVPQSFYMLAEFINRPIVKMGNNKATIYTSDKKVEVLKEGETTILKLNGKQMAAESFTKFFMNEGIFRAQDNNVLANVLNLYENFDSIYEIDYGKRIFSKIHEAQWIDVFKLDKNVAAIRIDAQNGLNEFYNSLNAVQTKVLVQEHVGFDISRSFRDLLPSEEAKVKEYNTEIAKIDETILSLKTKKEEILTEVNESAILRNDATIKELLEAIDTEISKLQESKSMFNNILEKFSTISIGFKQEEFVNEKGGASSEIEEFWMDHKNKDLTVYFAQDQEDGTGKWLVGEQVLSDFKAGLIWNLVEDDLSKAAAIKMAKDLAKKDDKGHYFETEEAVFTFESKVDESEIKDVWNNRDEYLGYLGSLLKGKKNSEKEYILDKHGFLSAKYKVTGAEFKAFFESEQIDESKDPDGNEKFDKKHTKVKESSPSSSNELGVGDKIRMPNGKLGTIASIDETNGKIIANMEDGKAVEVPKNRAHELEIVEHKSDGKQPIKTSDGSQSVQVKEGKNDETRVIVSLEMFGTNNFKMIEVDAKAFGVEVQLNGKAVLVTGTYDDISAFVEDTIPNRKDQVEIIGQMESEQVQENQDEWVAAQAIIKGKKEPVKVMAIEYTTGGDDDLITIDFKGKIMQIEKKFVNVSL